MNRNILNQAFITMGYRQMSSHNIGNIYGKPVGFGIIIAKINKDHKSITFKTCCRNYKEKKVLIWASKNVSIDFIDPKLGYEALEGEELYNKYLFTIANAEYKTSAEKIIRPVNGADSETFAFTTKNDIMSMFNL